MSVSEIQKYRKILESQGLNSASEAEQLASVKQNGTAIQYIKNPSERVQLAAVRQLGQVIEFIKKPASETVIKTAILKMIKDNILTQQIYQKYRTQYPDWSEWAAIDRSLQAAGKQLKEGVPGLSKQQRENLSNVSEKEQLAAIKNDWKNIVYIKNPSEAVQLAAVNENPVAITDIDNPTYAVKLAAVKNFGSAIRYLRGPADRTLVITAALTMIKNQEPAYDEIIEELQEEYPDFPEWALINKSLQAGKQIK